MRTKKLSFAAITILLVIASLLAACGAQEETGPAGDLDCEGHGEDGKCRVVLVNSFLGNDYRIQMQRAADAASKHDPYASAIDFEILNTENTPEAQRAGLENLIAEGVDAILLNAVDNTSVNDLVEKACEAGVEVITFDITARPGACEHAVEFAFYDWAVDAGNWLGFAAGVDEGPINVIMDKGLQGVSIADDIYQGGLDGMTAAAGGDASRINIIGEYFGEFAEGVQEPLVSAILAANPDKKIDVVFTQGYCTTIASAFENAGLDYLPVMYCQGYNSNQILCAEDGTDCFINAANFSGSIGSLDAAYRIFKGEEVPGEIGWPVDYVVTQDFDWEPGYTDAKVVQAEVGVTAFPDLPPGFSPAFNWPGAAVQITVEEAAGLE